MSLRVIPTLFHKFSLFRKYFSSSVVRFEELAVQPMETFQSLMDSLHLPVTSKPCRYIFISAKQMNSEYNLLDVFSKMVLSSCQHVIIMSCLSCRDINNVIRRKCWTWIVANGLECLLCTSGVKLKIVKKQWPTYP